MGEFTAQDAIRPRWDAALKGLAIRRFLYIAGALLAMSLAGAAIVVVSGLADSALLWLVLVVAPFASALASASIALVISCHALIGRILQKTAFPVFLGALVGIAVFAWAVALVFQTADTVVAHYASTGHLTACQITSYFDPNIQASERNDHKFWAVAAGYGLWPFQFRIVRDFILAFGALGFVSMTASFAIWWERKVAGRIQSRLGPMRVGGWHGWAQSIADGLKLIQKEDIVITGADKPLFKLAPYMVFIPVLAAMIALPFGAGWAFRDLDVALIFILSMVGIDVVGIILGGWASNNKWSVYGAMRVACQMVSYEIPMGMSLLIPVMTVGSLSLVHIGSTQAGGFQTWLAFANPFTFVATVVYLIASLASCKRAPFDLPEAESELVAGFHTEYSGFRWAVFMFGEYAAMIVVSGVATVLFFGAWYSPLPAAWGESLLDRGLAGRAVYGLVFAGPIWFIIKVYFLIYVQIWVRWTLPRIRIDQVMYACVQVLTPIGMVLLLGNTLWQLFVPGTVVGTAVNLVLTGIGVLVLAGFVATAAYGYSNRRRLVGSLVIDHLPGS